MSETHTTSHDATGVRPTSADIKPSEDLVDYLKDYARAEPQKAALWCVGIGFVLGWKLKPW